MAITGTRRSPGCALRCRKWLSAVSRPTFRCTSIYCPMPRFSTAAGARFGMPLEAERRRIGAGDALQRAVEQRNVGAAQIGGQGRRVHRKTVVLASDGDAPAI